MTSIDVIVSLLILALKNFNLISYKPLVLNFEDTK